MNRDTLLHRQVHPNFIRDGDPTSQAFTPTRKDNERLSMYDGDMITPALAWKHYTESLGHDSDGVASVSVAECEATELPVCPDPTEYPEHTVIDFSGLSGGQKTRKAKRLRYYANLRGWQFQP